MLSLKSRSGSWDIGTIPGESSHCNKLIFTYITDSDYDTGKKTGKNPDDIGNRHIKFASNFVIETQGICTKNYGTEPPEAVSGGNIIEPDPDTIVNKQTII
jgi:hypothetical protein